MLVLNEKLADKNRVDAFPSSDGEIQPHGQLVGRTAASSYMGAVTLALE